MKTGRGAEETAISSGVGEVGHRQGFQRLWAPPGDGDLLQIHGTGDLGGRQRLDGGGDKVVPGKGSLEKDGAYPQQGGGGLAGVQLLFLKPWYRRFCSSDRRPGWSPPAWARPWGGFQSQVEIRLTGWLPRRTPDRKWISILAATAQEEAGFLMMEEYSRRRQNTVAQYIATQSLLDLCESSERSLGGAIRNRWWKQVGIDLAGAREVAEAAADGDEGEE